MPHHPSDPDSARIRTILSVVDQGAKERRRQTAQVRSRFANDMPGHELRRVLEHVDEAVQFLQDVIRDVPRRARLAVQVNRNFGVAEADFLDEGAQLGKRRTCFLFRTGTEFVIIDG